MSAFIQWFRQSAPYIRAQRGKTIVLVFGGEVFESSGFADLVADVVLLHSLGVRVVVVAGSRPQIDSRLQARGVEPRFHDGLRITDADGLVAVKEAAGANRVELEQQFSMGLAAMAGARVRVAAGNFVVARPHGIIDGVDFGYTGRVRRIDVHAIRQRLDEGAVVILTPIGYSATGETFNLSTPELAADTAIALEADKLVALVEGVEGSIHTELDSEGASAILGTSTANLETAALETAALKTAALEAALETELSADYCQHLEQGLRAVRGGVGRVHLLDRKGEGAILHELYTRDGIGTMVTDQLYEGVRQADVGDVGSLMRILEPLSTAGKLVHRPREVLEDDIERFVLVERDGLVMGCAALYAFGTIGELACLAVDTRHQQKGRGEVLLRAIERRARDEGLEQLFVLTTQGVHWFQERGFEIADPDRLPDQRMQYDPQRNSKVLFKSLKEVFPKTSRQG